MVVELFNILDCLKGAAYALDVLSNPNEANKLTFLEFIRRIAILYLST